MLRWADQELCGYGGKNEHVDRSSNQQSCALVRQRNLHGILQMCVTNRQGSLENDGAHCYDLLYFQVYPRDLVFTKDKEDNFLQDH